MEKLPCVSLETVPSDLAFASPKETASLSLVTVLLRGCCYVIRWYDRLKEWTAKTLAESHWKLGQKLVHWATGCVCLPENVISVGVWAPSPFWRSSGRKQHTERAFRWCESVHDVSNALNVRILGCRWCKHGVEVCLFLFGGIFLGWVGLGQCRKKQRASGFSQVSLQSSSLTLPSSKMFWPSIEFLFDFTE